MVKSIRQKECFMTKIILAFLVHGVATVLQTVPKKQE